MPDKFYQLLTVADQQVHELHHYVLRWVWRADGQCEPVLYREGKRVTKAWRLVMGVDLPADDKGASANTAD